jgi:hypothetical protein
MEDDESSSGDEDFDFLGEPMFPAQIFDPWDGERQQVLFNGFFVKFEGPEPGSSEVLDMSGDIPRNFICLHGFLFRASFLYVVSSRPSSSNFGVIPRSIEVIYRGADAYVAYSCSWLEIIAFESMSELIYIDGRSFNGCEGLRSICIPSSVEIIRNNCFSWCCALSSLTFAASSKIVSIERRAFLRCSSLRSLHLPASLESIDGTALFSTHLSCITVEEDNRHLRVTRSFLTDFLGKTIIHYFGNDDSVEIPREVEVIGKKSFSWSSFSSLTFEPGSRLRLIAKGAFYSCNFASACIPSSAEALRFGCFFSSSLTSLKFEPGSNLVEIGILAFAHCAWLTAVCIPASVRILQCECFTNCTSLSSVTFESDPRLVRIAAGAFSSCASLKTICIPSSVELFDHMCFGDCTALSSLTFETFPKLTEIGQSAFCDCSTLESFCVPSSVDILCKYCFLGCRSLSSIKFDPGSRLSSIESDAFSKCSSLRSICLPVSVQKVTGSSFVNSGIVDIKVEEGNCHFSIADSFLMGANGSSIVRYFGSDKSVQIARGVEILSENCFSHCVSFSALTFESDSKLHRIDSHAFYACSSLQSIQIPASVVIIGEHAFEACMSLSSVTFEAGSKLEQIGSMAFSGLTLLRSICIPRSVKVLSGFWYDGTKDRTVIFESGASLKAIIESGEKYVFGSFEIEIGECDCDLDFDGFSVDDRRNANGWIRLVKKDSRT